VSVDLRARTGVFAQEGQRTLKLQEQVTRLFTELRVPAYRYLLCLGLVQLKRKRSPKRLFSGFTGISTPGEEKLTCAGGCFVLRTISESMSLSDAGTL